MELDQGHIRSNKCYREKARAGGQRVELEQLIQRKIKTHCSEKNS